VTWGDVVPEVGCSPDPVRELGNAREHGGLISVVDDRAFERLLDASDGSDWVVYAKPPFGGPEQVLNYLARYAHRVAFSNAPDRS
jgi:hypothetical protein